MSVIKGWRRAKKCEIAKCGNNLKKQNIKCLRVDADIGTKHLYLQELLLLSSANISRCWNLEIKRRTTFDIKLNLSSLSATFGSSYIKLTIWHPGRSPKPLVGTCLWTSFCGRSTLLLSWICLLTPFSSHGLAKGLINKKRIQFTCLRSQNGLQMWLSYVRLKPYYTRFLLQFFTRFIVDHLP